MSFEFIRGRGGGSRPGERICLDMDKEESERFGEDVVVTISFRPLCY